jgi:NAD(P)-dependent dehydrogenase (short-subunit alcohol dehydrogenase family)
MERGMGLLEGRVGMVTGAGRGIGRAIAWHCQVRFGSDALIFG